MTAILYASGDSYGPSSQPGDCRNVFHQTGYVVGQEVDGGDEKVAAAHRGVQHLDVEDGFGRVKRAQLGLPLGLWPAVALQLGGLLLERRKARLRQRLQGPVYDQVYELLGRVEAAAVLAGVGIEADGYPAGVVPDGLPGSRRRS